MISREFLINLGITGLTGLLIFLYFKNRMSRVEQKIDLMFQLIQEYEQAKTQMQITPAVGMSMSGGQREERDAPQPSLISISDDEDSGMDSSDSEEISDDEETLKIAPETISLSNKEVGSINLAGAETDSTPQHTANIDDLADISSIDDEITLEEVVEPINIEQSLDSKMPVVQEDVAEEVESIKKINLTDDADKPLSQHTVAALKQICRDRGFTNYNGLRKGKLIQLLESST